MQPKIEFATELRQSQIDYLEQMTEKYGLPDTAKAVRCLVTFAKDNGEHEQAIFEEVRCSGC